MTTAERAAEVIRAAIAHNACCDECAVLPDAPWAVDARLARDALMADPALLVDLAIEAGGLRPPESVFEVFTAGDGHPSMRGRSDLLERASRPTGEDRS